MSWKERSTRRDAALKLGRAALTLLFLLGWFSNAPIAGECLAIEEAIG